MSTALRIETTADAVREITRLAVRTIAAGGHRGHHTARVTDLMESDDVQAAIRRSFNRNTGRGLTVRDAFTVTGQALIAHYCNSAGIPTRD
ncbi:hypothetical protein [Streptomyces olivaceus]|uniref:hypothetical protein n=1 Tax=Streptomyces olivaceus TaxID=47716 RepID=UPI003629275A